MKPKSLMAMVVAAMLAWSGGALAGGKHRQNSVEAQMPSSMSESGASLRDPATMRSRSGIGLSPKSDQDTSIAASPRVDYWRMDEQPADVGATPGAGASGIVGSDGKDRKPGVE